VPRVVIIGGGITGLTAAHRLMKTLGAQHVTLIESAPRLGGKIFTTRADGFVLEGGPDCFLASKAPATQLCEELGLGPHIIGTNPALRRSFVKRGAALHPLPDGITGLVPSRLMPLMTSGVLSVAGRARAAMEMFVPRRKGEADESVASFVRRRFGNEAWQWLVEPLLSGIYAGDGEQLSVNATFPQLRETERRVGSLLKPMVAARFAPNASSAPRGFVTLSSGLQELVDALASAVANADVRLDTQIAAITAVGHEYRIEFEGGSSLTAAAIVFATPAYVTAALVGGIDSQMADELRAIPFVSTATISVAFDRADVARTLQGYGYVSPRANGGDIVACTWTSNKFPSRVPADSVLLRFFVGRAGAELSSATTDDALKTIVANELRDVLGITAAPKFTNVARWPNALPQYVMGHTDRVARISARAAEHRGLFVAGASYRGVGIPDCISSAWSAADSAAELLNVIYS
jgi:protoporphyrinogen/coproporphyrinogen III oxidase